MGAQTAYPVINLVETGRCIERRRRQAGLTVRELQAYFGFEYPQAIYKWQHGECLPTVDNLLALARLLQVSMEDLLVYEDRGVSHFFAFFSFKTQNGFVLLNHRFNDGRRIEWYSMHVERQMARRTSGAEQGSRKAAVPRVPRHRRQQIGYKIRSQAENRLRKEEWISGCTRVE